MIILHAASLNNQLLLWGETPAAENALPKKQRKSRSNRSQEKLYPFDTGFAALATALQEGAVGLTLEEKRSQPGTVWLPTLSADRIIENWRRLCLSQNYYRYFNRYHALINSVLSSF